MVDRIQPLTPVRPIINESGTMTDEARAWVQVVSDRAIIIGDVTPDGVVEAAQGAMYINTAGTTGDVFFVKQFDDVSGDRSQGWYQVG